MKKEYILVLSDIGISKGKNIGVIKCVIAYNGLNKDWSDMKKEIVRIANELKLGDITTKQAKEELLSLFGVSGSSFCEHCEPKEIDILRCKKCGSSDIYGSHTFLRCGDCGETYSGGV